MNWIEQGSPAIISYQKWINLLKGQPRVTIKKMDDAAIFESGLLYAVTHDGIILVGINPEIIDLLPTPVKAGGGNSL